MNREQAAHVAHRFTQAVAFLIAGAATYLVGAIFYMLITGHPA